MTFTIEEIMNLTEKWVITGELNPDMLADDFQFNSPYWKGYADKTEFLKKFLNPSEYIKTALSNITKFNPLLQFKGIDSEHFALIFQYHTKNGSSVWETVLGKVSNGKLIELRSIYDLEATRKAHEIK